MANVSLTNISKIYPAQNGQDLPTLHPFNLEIQDREVVALTGPRKCWISTIVRLIAGLETVSQGDISIGARKVNDVPPKDRDVAVVFNNHESYPNMSVNENLVFTLKRRRFSSTEITKRVQAAIDVVGLKEFATSKPASLSLEQRQRLALARVAALQPKVILFDEPLLNLEADTRNQLRKEIRQLHQRLQTTMIYATHDPGEAMAIGDRVVVLMDGVIQQDASALKVYDEPESVRVAQFVGNPPMNLIKGTLKQDGEWLLFSEMDQGTIQIRLRASSFPSLQLSTGKTYLLGVRAEEIAIAESEGQKYSGIFPAIIDYAETRGIETDFYLQTGTHKLICRTTRRPSDVEAGHRGQFEVNPSKARLFDLESGRRYA